MFDLTIGSISNPARQDKRGLKSKLAEKASMLLSNLSREQSCARKVHAQMVKAGFQVAVQGGCHLTPALPCPGVPFGLPPV